MPITGNASTALISGTIWFRFDTDFKDGDDAQKTRTDYINTFRDKVCAMWDNTSAPLLYKGNRVQLDVVFAPFTTGSSGWTLCVGNGKGDLAKTLFKPDDVIALQKISFVRYATEIGYMFQQKNAVEAPHEFGHMVRLADRYVNGYSIAPYTKTDRRSLEDRFTRETPPLSACFSKPLSDEAADPTAPYVPMTNLMSGPNLSSPTLTTRQLGFVFGAAQEPSYSVGGWVFWRQPGQKENVPVWFSNGQTSADAHPGISYKTASDEANSTPCNQVTAYNQYCSFKPLPLGLRLHNHKDSNGLLVSRWAGASRAQRDLHKKFVRQLSEMNQ